VLNPSPAAPAALRAARLAAAVGLLSRNVVVRGAVAGPDDAYGGHVFVGQVSRAGQRAFVGSLAAAGVEFRDMGQGATQFAAVDFQYGGFLFANGADAASVGASQGNAAAAPAGANSIASSSFRNCRNGGVAAVAAAGVAVRGSVLAGTRRSGLDFDADSGGATIQGNLVAGSLKGDDVNAAGQTQWVVPQAGVFLASAPALLADNLVAGAFDAAYTLRAAACPAGSAAYDASQLAGAGAPYMRNNEAAASLVGVFVLPTASAGGGCVWVDGFTAWKCAHAGLLAVDQRATDFRLTNSLLADNHIGVALNFVAASAGVATSSLVDVAVVGAGAASSCAEARRGCRAMTADDVTGAAGCAASIAAMPRETGRRPGQLRHWAAGLAAVSARTAPALATRCRVAVLP